MRETHIILRNPRLSTRDVFLGAAAGPAAAAEEAPAAGLHVEVEQIERRDIPALTSQGEILAVAPSMPMRLIVPVEDAPTAVPAAPTLAWGVQAVGADTSPFSGQGIVVAVLDTGIDRNHPAFAGVTLVEEDFTTEGNGDRDGHGTHCAGTIFGRDVQNNRIGIARGVTRALIGKVLGQGGGESLQIAQAIQWAVQNGAHVISMSLGIDFPGYARSLQEERGFPPELATSRALEAYRLNVQLFQTLAAFVDARGGFSEGAAIVAAAGNESDRLRNPDFEIAVSPPAVANGIVSVAALGQGPQGFDVAPFSNTGANLSGPGVQILSAAPGGGFATKSGTSMATPHVAGVAALWAERIRSTGFLNPLLLKARLLGSATTAGLRNGIDPFDIGLGLVRAPQA
jgi:subtilisin family serine protease